MEIGSIDLTKYLKSDYLEAYIHLRDKNAKVHIRMVSANVQEIIDGMRYFMEKYSLDIGLVLDPEKVLDHIRERHPNDYEEIWLVCEILKRGDRIHGRLFSARHDLVVVRRNLALANRKVALLRKDTETILTTLFHGYLVTSANFMILKTSHRFPPVLGYSSADLVGKSLYDFLPETHKDILVPETTQKMKPESRKYVLKMRKNDGNLALVLLYVITILDVEEGFQQTIVLIADLTKKTDLVEKINEVVSALELSEQRALEAQRKIKDADHRAAEILRKSEEEKRRAEEARKTAITDALTGIRNRRAFNTDIQGYFNKVMDVKIPELPHTLSLAYLDIDDFKFINDAHGHPNGDIILQQVWEKLSSFEGEQLAAYRIWGEEFAIIWIDVNIVHMKVLAEELRSYFEKKAIPIEDGKTICFTLSIWLVEYNGNEFRNSHEMCVAADKLLYVAKTTGKNRVVSS